MHKQRGESRKGNLERGIPKEEESIQKNEIVWKGKQTEWQTSEIKKWEAYSLGLLSVCPQCQPCHNCKWLRVVTQIIQDIQVCLDMSGYRKKLFSDTRMWRDDWSQHISTTLPVILRRSNPFEVIEAVHMKATTHKTLPRVVRCQKIRVILVSAGNVWATYTRLMAYRQRFCGWCCSLAQDRNPVVLFRKQAKGMQKALFGQCWTQLVSQMWILWLRSGTSDRWVQLGPARSS